MSTPVRPRLSPESLPPHRPRPLRRRGRRLLLTASLLATLGAAASPARAADDKSGVQPTHVVLPKGPGSLGGVGENADVNASMGLMTYGIDIQVPEGYAGTTPKLRLGYSSGAGNSEVGIGWSLGVPTIERMTARVLPSYNANDTFVVNGGEELVRVGTSQTYRARFESSFVKYTWVDAVGNGVRGYWKAEYPDGTIGYFGAHSNGVVTDAAVAKGNQGAFRYYLAELVDPFGHKLTYDYVKDGAVSLLSRVSYVFEGSTPRYTVNFTYATRPDLLSDAKPGFQLVGSKRLTGITVDVKNIQLRRYALTYETTDVSGGFSRLSSVTMFGAGSQGPSFPVAFNFGYSGGLGACTTGDCAPAVVSMDGPLGFDLQTGTGDLIDMNGDSLPDVVNTGSSSSQFFINTPTATAHTFADPVTSSQKGSSNLALPSVQLADLDGDGFSDLYDSQANTVQLNTGKGDFAPATPLSNVNAPPFTTSPDVRFFDYNNDKQIDAIFSSAGSTSYYVNQGGGHFSFVPGATSIGVAFDSGQLQLADVNGDGLADAVQVTSGKVQYRLDLGWGVWSDWVVMTNIPTGFAGATLHDVNGDGLADLVLVNGNQVSYALSQNGKAFAPPVSLNPQNSGLPIPQALGATIRYADMNGNGSTDIVWFDQGGQATYLELFPKRPNLITHISNSIGKNIDVTYGSSVAHMIQDGGSDAWDYRLPHAFLTVDSLTTSDSLTGTRQTRSFHYSNGYYDGAERQFRGYTDIVESALGDASVEAGLKHYSYEVGQLDVYRRNLLLFADESSGGRLLTSTANAYGDCNVGGIAGAQLPFPIRFVCKVSATRTIVEGTAADQAPVVSDAFTYDAYGNVTQAAHAGVVSASGDESLEVTSYVSPDSTGGRWILHAPAQKQSYGQLSPSPSAVHAEENYFYDGPAFQGLPAGQLTSGLLTRKQALVNDGVYVDVDRRQYDANGAVVEQMDANGHHRSIAYDADSILPLSETIHFDDPSHAPYDLQLTAAYDPLLETVTSNSSWTRLVGGAAVSPVQTTTYAYDAFGRLTAVVRPGDASGAPTESYGYTLADPISQITHATSSQSGQAADLLEAQCFDGMGRLYQKRSQVAPGNVLVDGFTVFNAQGQVAAKYQEYTATTLACDAAPPSGVLASTVSYDAKGRTLSSAEPDGDLYGTASVKTTTYLPLETITYDEEDAAGGLYPNTPTVTHFDGLGRTTALERYATAGAPLHTTFGYDELGNLQSIVDPKGNTKTQTFDRAGRIVAVNDPDTGLTTFAHDAVGNLVAQTDARGTTTRTAYDEANRLLARWDDADQAGTQVTYTFDVPASCPAGKCALTAGQLAEVSYPVDGGIASDWRGYDARGNVVYFARSIDGQTFEVQTAYDNASRAVGKVFPNGRALVTALDGLGRTANVPGVVTAVGYDARGLRSGMTFANGVTSSFLFDSRMRLAALTSGVPDAAPIQSYTYAYDRVGNVLSVADGTAQPGAPSENASYTYDALYRLLSANLDTGRGAPEEVETFAYDAIDNLVTKSSSLGAASVDHVGDLQYGGAGPHEVTAAGDVALAYDAAGNVVSRGDLQLAWDHRNRLVGASRAGAAVATFAYDSDLGRVKKVEGAHTTYYVTDEYEVRDGVPSIYVHVGGDRVARIDGSSAATAAPSAALALRPGTQLQKTLLASAQGLSGATASGETVTYLYRNALGTVTATGDASGAVASRTASYPYGAPRTADQADIDYVYTGKERDSSTALTYFGARYLDPWTGGWASADPTFLVATDTASALNNRFDFAGHNPTSRIDPDGRTDLFKGQASWSSKYVKVAYKDGEWHVSLDVKLGAQGKGSSGGINFDIDTGKHEYALDVKFGRGVGLPEMGGETKGIKSKLSGSAGPQLEFKITGNAKHAVDSAEFSTGFQASASAGLEAGGVGGELEVSGSVGGHFRLDHVDGSGRDRPRLEIWPEFAGGVKGSGSIGNAKGSFNPNFSVGRKELGADTFLTDGTEPDRSPKECAPEATPAMEQQDLKSEPVQ